MTRQPGCLPTIIPDQSAVGLVQVSDASGNLSWQPLTATTDIAPTGLTGATAASRYVGATTAGAPVTGTFAAGDYVIDETGSVQICTAAGSPGTWGSTGGLIAQNTVATTAASITFTAIPQTYTQLRLVAVGASSAAAEVTRWFVRLNGDSGANYDIQAVDGVNATASAAANNAQAQWLASGVNDLPGASATSGVPGMLEVVIPGYAGTTFRKIGMWRSGYSDAATSAADATINVAVSTWRSTAAVTSIAVSPVSGSFVAGTTAYLYAS